MRLGELNTSFKCELNTRIRKTNLAPVFFYLKKWWGELSTSFFGANLTPELEKRT
jgi:hypothetical protein